MGWHGEYKPRRLEVGESLLSLRTRAKLTQVELAALVGVSHRSVQGWEAGTTYPQEDKLRQLISTFLAHGALTPGQEYEEAYDLWQLVSHDARRRLDLFDEKWFADLLVHYRSEQGTAPEQQVSPVDNPPTSPIGQQGASLIDWGEAPDIPVLHGREAELATLQQWVVADRCRVVALLGLGGIGKTSLAITFAHRLAASFEHNAFDVLFFRSLKNGPPLAQVLDQSIRAISSQQALLPESTADKITLLVQLLRQQHCLLILDNFETLLQPGTLTGTYRTEHEDYALLLSALAERDHKSCLLLTSREKPAELGPVEGRIAPVRTLQVTGLPEQAGRLVLEAKELAGTVQDLRALVRVYAGNPLALNLVSESIHSIFSSDVASFLETGDAFFNGMGRLLDQQFTRLTLLEQSIMYQLAVARELLPLNDLVAAVGERVPQREVLSALESLRRRMLIEHTLDHPAFTLQPVVLEYTTERFVESIHREVIDGQPILLPRHPLIQATAKEYIRRSQERMIARPLLERLVATYAGKEAASQQLLLLLTDWRHQPHLQQGHGPGNIVNLLRLLHGDVNGMDFSNLLLRDVYLQGVAAHGASLSHSRLERFAFQEPFDGIESVTCSPDMRYVAIGTIDGEIRLWEVASRTTLLAVKAHTGPVVDLALSLDGQLLVSGSADGTIRLWDVATGDNLAILTGHKSVVWSVALSADKRLLASGSGSGRVRLWKIDSHSRSGTCIAILEGHTNAVYSVALSMDGRLLVSGSFDGTVRLWDLASILDGNTTDSACLAVLRDHRAGVCSIAISANGEVLASGSYDHTVRLWDITHLFLGGEQAPPCLAVLEGHTGEIRSVAISADGRIVASGSGDKTVRLWEIAPSDLAPSGLASSSLTSSSLTSPGRDACFAILEGHTNSVMSIALSADGQLLASASTDGTARLWEVRSGTSLATFEGYIAAMMSVALSADGKIVASGSTDGKVRLWEVDEGRLLATLLGHTNMVMTVAFSGDGQRLASGSGDGTIRVWDVHNLQQFGKCLATFSGHTNVVRGVALSSDGGLLASASYDGTIRLWDVSRGVHLCTLRGHTNMVMSVAFSSDDSLLASSSFDGTVRLWDIPVLIREPAEIPGCISVLSDHTAVVYDVTLSGDGRWLASCSFDRTVRLWDLTAILNPKDQAAPPVLISEGHTDEVWGVALSKDGKRLATGDTEGRVRLWEAGEPDGGWRNLASWQGHTSLIWSVSLSADGQLVASASADGTVQLWGGTHYAHLATLRVARPYESMNITALTGITEAQRVSLLALGAVERSE